MLSVVVACRLSEQRLPLRFLRVLAIVGPRVCFEVVAAMSDCSNVGLPVGVDADCRDSIAGQQIRLTECLARSIRTCDGVPRFYLAK